MGITILLADSVVGVRQIERTLLEKEPDIEVVGEAADEPEGDDAHHIPGTSNRSYRLQHSTDGEDFCQANQIPTPKDKGSGCDRTQGKIR